MSVSLCEYDGTQTLPISFPRFISTNVGAYCTTMYTSAVVVAASRIESA